LANERRLRLLKAVLVRPGCHVTALAKGVGLSVPVASQYLRDLQARGLLSVERRGRWTCYGDRPDRTVGHAAPLAAALRQALVKDGVALARVRRTLLAFSQPRRLVLLSVLSPVQTLRVTDLHQATGISVPALLRHLRKLEACGLVTARTERWMLAVPLSALARDLLRQARGAAGQQFSLWKENGGSGGPALPRTHGNIAN
jgi:DNA-binding transcriptional ArsR family regulator